MNQRKFLVHLGLLLAACVVTAGLIYWQTSDPPYVEVLLKVNSNSYIGDGKLDRESLDSYAETQRELVKSNYVVTAALRQQSINQLPLVRGLGRHPVDEIANSIKTARSSTELIQVRIPLKRWISVQEAREWKQVLDEVVDSYLRESVNKERIDRIDQLSKLRRRYQTTYQMVTKKADEIKKYEELLGVSSAQAWRKDYQLRRIDRLESKLLELQLKQQALEITAGEQNDVELEIVKQQVASLTERRDSELEELPSGEAGADGQLHARRQDFLALQNDMLEVRQEMQQLEKRIDGADPVSLLQRATISYEKNLGPFELLSSLDN